jgi:hypothetical protein
MVERDGCVAVAPKSHSVLSRCCPRVSPNKATSRLLLLRLGVRDAAERGALNQRSDLALEPLEQVARELEQIRDPLN